MKDNNMSKKINSKYIVLAVVIVALLRMFLIIRYIIVYNNIINSNQIDINKKTVIDKQENIKESLDNNLFLMAIEDVFRIEYDEDKYYTFVTGKIESGEISVNDDIQIIGLNQETITTRVSSIEVMRKQYSTAKKGENVSIRLDEIDYSKLARGQILVTPNTIESHTEFEADIKMYDSDNNYYFENNSELSFFFRTINIIGVITLDDELKTISSNDKAHIKVVLSKSVGMYENMTFYIRNNGVNIGEGIITTVY